MDKELHVRGKKISCNERGEDLLSSRNLIIVLVRYGESILNYGVIMLAFKLLFHDSTVYFNRNFSDGSSTR